jgi:hypothetical protein
VIRVYIALGLVLALIGAGAFLYTRGAAVERTKTIAKAAANYQSTRERIDNAISGPRTDAVILDRLHSYAQ